MFPLALLTLVATGPYMVSSAWAWNDGWIDVAIGGVVLLFLGGEFVGSRGRTLARAYPRPAPEQRRVPSPKHDLLHRLKRLWRFLENPRIDAQALHLALIPATIAALGPPRILGLAIDWTFFDSVLPSGRRIRYQVLRIAVPRRGRALPLLQLLTFA